MRQIRYPTEGLEPPDIWLNSSFENTVGGLLPFQLEGYHFLKDRDAGIALWGTGMGKANLLAALTKQARAHDEFDFALIVAKAHNKVNLQRTLLEFADLESIVIEGTIEQRLKLYESCIEAPRGTILILNYEKFRDDFCDVYKKHSKIHIDLSPIGRFFFSQDLLICWDEAPTKLKNRGTQLYKSVCKCLYASAPALKQSRPKSLKQYIFTATPIENGPEDFFNCVRLISPETFGTIAQFHDEFVATYNPFNQWLPDTWRNLDRLGRKAEHLIHKASKDDPELVNQFPKIIEQKVYIDWEPRHAYNQVWKLVRDAPDSNIFSQIMLLQMMCNMPTMIEDSAKRRAEFEEELEALLEAEDNEGAYPIARGSTVAQDVLESLTEPLTDNSHPKLLKLKELLLEEHPDDKIVLFSAFNHTFFPKLINWLKRWGVSYVYYDGKDKQKAYDEFQQNPSVRIFLSSDQGSDSINLHSARVVVHYDLPHKWSTFIQRQNRIHRLSSDHKTVIFYTLLIANSIEDRKLKIITRKKSYHESVFESQDRLTSADLKFILEGP